jgi:hypothetical protein
MQIKINEYDTIETGRYNGKWQIKPGRVDQNGIFRPDFKQIKKKDGTTQAIPVSITFDKDEDAIEFFKACVKDLEAGK